MATLSSSVARGPARLLQSSPVRGGNSRRSVAVSARKTAAKTAYICIDCGWIYDGKEQFEKLPNSYKCPVCQAPKRRFRKTEAGGRNDPKSLKARQAQLSESDGKFDEGDKQFFAVAAIGGAVLLAGLYFYLNSQTSL